MSNELKGLTTYIETQKKYYEHNPVLRTRFENWISILGNKEVVFDVVCDVIEDNGMWGQMDERYSKDFGWEKRE